MISCFWEKAVSEKSKEQKSNNEMFLINLGEVVGLLKDANF